MKARLAFSIACLINPDIIILDEVLSVGDGSFRMKSEDRMKQILRSGVTGLLVSHSVTQVRTLCNKILWLHHGKQVCFKQDVQKTCDAYEEFLITQKLPANQDEMDAMADAYQTRLAKKREEKCKTEQEQLVEMLRKGTPEASERAAIEFLKSIGKYRSNL